MPGHSNRNASSLSPGGQTPPLRLVARPAPVEVPAPLHETSRERTSGSTTVAPAIHCDACDAVCCRLTVVLGTDDDIPERLTDYTAAGLHVMARDEEGWCVAIDAARMCCSIYESRPEVCRRFAMGGPYCREVRADYADRRARGIPLTLY